MAHGFIKSLEARQTCPRDTRNETRRLRGLVETLQTVPRGREKGTKRSSSLDYLKSDLGKAAYPDDLTCVNVAPMPSSAPMDVDSDQEMYDDDG